MDKFGEMTVFLRVAEDGSFSSAGRMLSLSPSAVSKLIARLEARLNVRLFERVAGTIRLTEEGQRFRHASTRVVAAMEEAENVAASPLATASGTLHIHAPLTTAKYLLAPLMPTFLDRHPALRLEFIISTDRADFVKGGVDVAIHSGRPTEMSLIARPLMPRPWVIAAAPVYLERHGTPHAPEDLHRHRCLNFTTRTQWNSWTFQEDGQLKTMDLPSQVGANQGELLRTLAVEGLGVVRLARFSIEHDLRAGALVPLLTGYTDHSDDMLYVLYARGRVIAPRVRAFLQMIDEQFPLQGGVPATTMSGVTPAPA